MTSAFIINIEVPEVSAATLSGIAEQISESCQEDGLSVISCQPYKHPTLEAQGPEFSEANLLGPTQGLW